MGETRKRRKNTHTHKTDERFFIDSYCHMMIMIFGIVVAVATVATADGC